MSGKQNAISIFKAAVDAVHPSRLIPLHVQFLNDLLIIEKQQIQLSPTQKIFVIGAGKASAAMAFEIEQIIGERIYKGLITTKYHHAIPLKKIKCIEASHPIPDENSFHAVNETLQLLKEAGDNDIIICLLSGGASSLWADTPDEIKEADLLTVFDVLLKCGATIEENNTIRKHVSKIKGGQLLRYAPKATWFSLIISDVPGDDLSVIASGPTVADNSTYATALSIIEKYNIKTKVPARVWEYLQRGSKGLFKETLKKGDPLLKQIHNLLIGNNTLALKAAGEKATALGYHLHYFDTLSGDAALMGNKIIRFCKSYKHNLPACILTGGETTVVVKGNGIGGRNQHMALSALIEMKKRDDTETASFTFLSAGTDGTDGPTDAAGAIADIESVAMCVQKNLDPQFYFDQYDAYSFFKQTGGLLKTGPTQTNVMDLTIVLIE